MSFTLSALRIPVLALLASLSLPLAAQTQTPFSGAPIPLPGTFEAENFDNGGEGVAYHDNVAGNAGGQYRTGESVDIIVSRDPEGGGYSVNNFETGEWLEYTVDIAAAGQYEIALRVASGTFTGAFRIEIDGNNVTGSVAVPPTGNFGTFVWVAKRGVSLPAGQHVLRLVSEQQYFDVNQMRVTATPTTPFVGVITIPGTFEAENYDTGGQDISYSDTTATNDGGQFRTTEGVDLIVSRDPDDAGSGYSVNNFRTGEWLVYTVSVANTGLYDIEARVASGTFTNAALHVEIDGVNVTGSVLAPATGDFGTYEWIGKRGVSLSAGQHVLKLVSDQEYVDVNRIRVTAVTHTPFGGTPIQLPNTFEAENFDLGGEGNAYHDNVAGNAGGQYRPSEGVDIIASADSLGGNYVVNNFETGEWLAYTVNIAQAGLYDIDVRTASGTFTGAFHIEIDDADVTGPVTVPPTGNFATFQWAGKTGVQLPAGQHVLKLVSEQQYFDVNQIRVVASGTPPPTGEVEFSCSFEAGFTQCGFSEQAKVPGRATLVNIGRDGGKAVRLHTEPGDNNVSGSNDRERNDLTLGSRTDCSQGKEQWWAHSVLFPSDFIVPSGNGTGLAFDFHHTGSNGQANFHVRFLRNTSGGEMLQFEVVHGDPLAPIRTRQTFADPLVRNQWYDFVYHVRWTSGSEGFFDAWVNGEKKMTYRGPTLYPGMGCYLKLANYHSATGASSIIHDRVIRGTTPGAVALTPLQP